MAPIAFARNAIACIDTRHFRFKVAKSAKAIPGRTSRRKSFSGIKKADANALASRSASSGLRSFPKCITVCPNSCARLNRVLSAGFAPFKKNSLGNSGTHRQSASISSTSRWRSITIPPCASIRSTKFGNGPGGMFIATRAIAATFSTSPAWFSGSISGILSGAISVNRRRRSIWISTMLHRACTAFT